MNIGYDIELLFEQRLRQLGYRGACRPTREDCGVDYVLFTTKGWMGVQVKSARENNRNSIKRGRQPSGQLRAKICGSGNTIRDVEYYRASGVKVFALHDKGVFYLIPIEESGRRSVQCTVASPFREAWHLVLGSPVEQVTPVERTQKEITEMETLYTEAP
jgi:hypothetical protein